MALIREIKRLDVWKRLSHASMLEYLEVELGHSPRVALERIRMAHELVELPMLDAALASGERCFSAIRELTRVATPATEAVWLAWSADKNVRDIERGVLGHEKGALPNDPVDHEKLTERVWFEVAPTTYALMREARKVLNQAHGEVLDDDSFVASMARAVIDGGGDVEGAPYQIAIKVCPSCEKGTQNAAGVEVPIDRAMVEQAKCDALVIGSLDGKVPDRAEHTIPPAVRRFVLARDEFRCVVPECRITWGFEADHIEGIAECGKIDNSPQNLCTLCFHHHRLKHQGQLLILGKAPDLTIVRLDQPIDLSAVAAACSAIEADGMEKYAAAELVGRVVRAINFAHVGTKELHAAEIIRRARDELREPQIARRRHEIFELCPRGHEEVVLR